MVGAKKNRILKTKEKNKFLNHLCDGYKSFFISIHNEMNLMSTLLRLGKPAAQIMDILEKDCGRYEPPMLEDKRM